MHRIFGRIGNSRETVNFESKHTVFSNAVLLSKNRFLEKKKDQNQNIFWSRILGEKR